MTFPTGDSMIPLAKAQEAIHAVSDAFEAAIREQIEDEHLRQRVLAVAASNVFYVMLSKAREELREQKNLNPTYEQDDKFNTEAKALFDKIFDSDEGVE